MQIFGVSIVNWLACEAGTIFFFNSRFSHKFEWEFNHNYGNAEQKKTLVNVFSGKDPFLAFDIWFEKGILFNKQEI